MLSYFKDCNSPLRHEFTLNCTATRSDTYRKCKLSVLCDDYSINKLICVTRNMIKYKNVKISFARISPKKHRQIKNKILRNLAVSCYCFYTSAPWGRYCQSWASTVVKRFYDCMLSYFKDCNSPLRHEFTLNCTATRSDTYRKCKLSVLCDDYYRIITIKPLCFPICKSDKLSFVWHDIIDICHPFDK
jgi:hypothetical protein